VVCTLCKSLLFVFVGECDELCDWLVVVVCGEVFVL